MRHRIGIVLAVILTGLPSECQRLHAGRNTHLVAR
jgi:hypothetical protein